MAFNFKMPYEKKVLPQRESGIYIHIPFCRSKCQYCDFYSLGGSREKAVTDRYLQALTSHFKETGARATGYVVDTVYFGGGTPSFFGAAGSAFSTSSSGALRFRRTRRSPSKPIPTASPPRCCRRCTTRVLTA